jgi:hypothetical protein
MRSTLVNRIAAILAILIFAGLAGAQPLSESKPPRAVPPSIKPPAQAAPEKGLTSGLEAMLADALRNNPDIRVAEAKVHEAEAELNRVRLQVMQKVILARHTVESQKAAVAAAEDRLKVLLDQHSHGNVPVSAVQAAEAALAKEKAALAAVDVDLPMLLGRPPQSTTTGESDRLGFRTLGNRLNLSGVASSVAFSPDGKLLATQRPDGAVVVWDAATGQQVGTPAQIQSAPATPTRGALADKIRRALDSPITVDIPQKKPLGEVLKFFEQQFPGISFQPVVSLENYKLSLHFEQMPFGAVIQAVGDSHPDLAFVVRDYGILVTDVGMVPEGAPLLHDFWKGRAASAPARVGPGSEVEGVIKATDPQAGVVTINIGSDQGLSKGSTLEVYRLTPSPAYLGRLEVIAVNPHDAVAKPNSRARGPLQAGDRVTTTPLQGR